MFWSKRTVFLSYRDRNPEDKLRAERLAGRLRKRRLKPILEEEKVAELERRPGQDLPSVLYDQLSEADAVISILSASALQSRYIFFEALTAKLQKKWFPVVFDDVSIPEELSGPYRTKLTDAQLEDPNDRSVASLAESIKRASSARHYYGTTRLQEGRKNIFIVVVGVLAAAASFLSNLGNIRTHICANVYFSAICKSAGWHEQGTKY